MGEHEKGDADAPWGAGIALDFVRPRMGMKKAPELGGEGLHEIRGEYSTCGYETPVSPPRAGTGRAELTERTGRSSRPWLLWPRRCPPGPSPPLPHGSTSRTP